MIANSNKTIAFVGGPDISLRLELLKLVKCEGFNVLVIGSNRAEEKLFHMCEIPYYYYELHRSMLIIKDLGGILQLYKIFKRTRPDIIHAFDTIPAISGRIAAKAAGVPVIIGTITGMGSLFSFNNIRNMMLRVFYIIVQKIACGISDLTIFQNNDDLHYFVSKRIIPSSKSVVVKGSGVDLEKYSANKMDPDDVKKKEEELGIEKSYVKIFMISRLVKYKGVYEYLEAAKQVRMKYDHVQFYLAGPVDDTIASFSESEMRKYGNYVQYIGERNDIAGILYFADVVVLPTYYREGIPRVLLEAASMEKPLITTDMPGCKDVVEDGLNGFTVPTNNPQALSEAMEKLILDGNLRVKMGKLSRQIAIKEFSMDIIFKDTINIYRQLLNNGRKHLLRSGRENGSNKSIKIIWLDEKYDLVKPDLLNNLISANKIMKFKRAEGWVTIGIDQIRKQNCAYRGTERRRRYA